MTCPVSSLPPLLLRRLHRMPLVDLLHNPLCPPYCIGNGCDGSRNPRSTVVLRQLSGRENRRHDSDYALATFVHLGSLALSLCVRHRSESRRCGRSKARSATSTSGSRMPLLRGHKACLQRMKRPSRAEPLPAAKSSQNRLAGVSVMPLASCGGSGSARRQES